MSQRRPLFVLFWLNSMLKIVLTKNTEKQSSARIRTQVRKMAVAEESTGRPKPIIIKKQASTRSLFVYFRPFLITIQI